MDLVSSNRVDLATYGLTGSAHVRLIHIRIHEDEITSELKSLIEHIQNTSWIGEVASSIDRVSLTSRVSRTVEDLKTGIFSGSLDKVTEDTGEYLVSHSAGLVLKDSHGHLQIPLSELWNKKKSGNPGFDFHTEHPENILVFGEAKFSGQENLSPYSKALKQICDFITLGKDNDDLSDLKVILGSSISLDNIVDSGVKGYAAAFSINANDPAKIFSNAIKSEHLLPLLNYAKVYLIGIEICPN